VNVEPEQLVNSGVATATYLKEIFPDGGEIFIVGERGLIDAMSRYGFSHSDRTPLAVVAGLDRQVTYDKLSKATLFIRSGLPFIGTNPDKSIPTAKGLEPGAGAILAALEAASDVPPKVIGKPNPEMYEVALGRLGTEPKETLVVGDRLETDIAGGQLLGCPTALVLSGVTTKTQSEAWDPRPDFIVSDLTELLSMI
jgi:4-nitrophenyl phosphatase